MKKANPKQAGDNWVRTLVATGQVYDTVASSEPLRVLVHRPGTDDEPRVLNLYLKMRSRARDVH